MIVSRAPRKLRPCFPVSACKRRHDVHHVVPSSNNQNASSIPKKEEETKKHKRRKLDTVKKSSSHVAPSSNNQKASNIPKKDEVTKKYKRRKLDTVKKSSSHVVPSSNNQKASRIPKKDGETKKYKRRKLDTVKKSLSLLTSKAEESEIVGDTVTTTVRRENSFPSSSEIPQVPSYVCTFCGLEFATPPTLVAHVRNNHQDDGGPFQCKKCPFSSDDAPALVVHTLRNCKLVTAFSCSFCTRDFSSIRCKEIHETRHRSASNEVHECPECGEVYFRACLMTKHILTEHK